MEDQMMSQLEQFLSVLRDTAGTASEFVVEQTPLIVQEYLSWYFWSSVVWVSICLPVFVGTVLLSCWIMRLPKDAIRTDDRVGWTCLSSLVSVVSLIFLVFDTFSILRVTVAPRLVVLQYVTDLIKELAPYTR